MGIYKPVIDISGNAGSATKLANDSGVAPSHSCRAWVNFNGTGTVAIRSSGNVSSITDNGTGDYTANFASAMPDANFSTCGMQMPQISAAERLKITSTSISGVRVINSTCDASNISYDTSHVAIAIFR